MIWLNGESQDSLKQSIIQEGLSISVAVRNDNNVPRNYLEIFQDFVSAFKSKNRLAILLVIDNVDAANQNVELLLQKAVKLKCFALVTSRQLDVLNFAGEIINLDVLLPKDAKQLFNDSVTAETAKDINRLTHLLQYFPLALQQAISYIKAQKITGIEGKSYKIKNYLNEYEKKKSKMLDFKLNSIDHQYSLTTIMTWNISINQIKQMGSNGKNAINLLNMMSYCEADIISVNLLQTVFRDIDRDSIINAVELLKLYSLIKVENSEIYIHRLVQEVTRLECSSTDYEKQMLTKICQALLGIIENLQQNDVRHILSIWTHASKHDAMIRQFSKVPNDILFRLHDISEYREMLEFARICYDRFATVLGKEHLETLNVERHLASATLKNGIYKEALVKYRVVLEKQIRVLGEDHHITLITGHELALALINFKRYDEAMKQFQTVLTLSKKVLGESHINTVATKHAIASVFTHQGKLNKAMQIYEEVLDWQTTNLGPKHPSTLITRHNIGNCLYQQGEVQRAKQMLEHVLSLDVKLLGVEHSDTLTTKSVLAMTINHLGERQKALHMLNEVSNSQENVLGRGHPNTLSTRSNIATILYAEEEYSRVREILEVDMLFWINLHGEEHTETIEIMSLLASTLPKLCELCQALELFQQVLTLQNRVLEPGHNDILWTQSQIKEIITKV